MCDVSVCVCARVRVRITHRSSQASEKAEGHGSAMTSVVALQRALSKLSEVPADDSTVLHLFTKTLLTALNNNNSSSNS